MAGEIWTDQADVGVELVTTTWANNVQDNLKVLRRGNGYATIETATIATSLTLPNEYDNTFNLSPGGGTIDYISTAGRQLGNSITLNITGGCTLHSDSETPGTGFARIHIVSIITAVSGPISLSNGMVITLKLLSYNGNLCWMFTF
jgi:hypothetical protein